MLREDEVAALDTFYGKFQDIRRHGSWLVIVGRSFLL